jgi:hypothetical protein
MADVGIGDIFHIIHVSETLEPLDAFYDSVFGPRRGIMDGSYSALEKRDASLIAIGNCIIEPMAPSKHVEGWDVSIWRTRASGSSAATTTRSWPTRRRLSAHRSGSPPGMCRETRGIDRRRSRRGVN